MCKNGSLVTVVVISYNSSSTVIETLDSVKEQTYKNIELIITDDGSSDDTVEICKNWLNLNGNFFSNCQIITVANNTGIPANCNRALYASKGKWIKIIAADDTLKKECIEINIKYVTNNSEVEILQTNADMYLDILKEDNLRGTLPVNFKEFFEIKEGKEQYKFLKNIGYGLCTPAMFIKKAIIEKVGGFDERFKLMEDLPLWFNLTKAGKRIYYHPVSTVNYRAHDNSVTRAGKKYGDAIFLKDALFFLQIYFDKDEKNFKIKKSMFQLRCLIYLDEYGFNNKSKLSRLLYAAVNRI